MVSLHWNEGVVEDELSFWFTVVLLTIIGVLPMPLSNETRHGTLILIWSSGLLGMIDGWPYPTIYIKTAVDQRVEREPAVLVVCALVYLDILILLTFAFVKLVLRCMRAGQCQCIGVDRLWDIEALPADSQFEYHQRTSRPYRWLARRWRWLPHADKSWFCYSGALNKDGVPHGLGHWWDTGKSGECLFGYWEEGRPVGPFSSYVTTTGYRIECILLAVCVNRNDGWKGCAWTPGPDPEGAKWAVVSCECSVSGQFFKSLPQWKMVSGPKTQPRVEANTDAAAWAASASWCVQQVQHLDELGTATQSVVISIDGEQLHVSGHIAQDIDDRVTIRLIDGCDAVPTGLRRLTVFAHAKDDDGNEDPDGASTEPDVAPKPASNAGAPSGAPAVTPSAVMSSCASSTSTTPTFEGGVSTNNLQLVVDRWKPATEVGYEAVVYVHGCNTPLVEAVLDLGQLFAMAHFPPYVKPVVYGWPSGSVVKYVRAMMTAESEAVHSDFVAFLQGLIDSGISRIHLIAHSMGGRMITRAIHAAAHLFTPTAHADVNASKANAHPHSPKRVPLKSVILLHPETDLKRYIAEDFPVLRRVCSNICLYTDRHDLAVRTAEWGVFNFGLLVAFTGGPCRLRNLIRTPYPGYKSLGLHPDELLKPNGMPLDMDVIDISWMDHNVSGHRHNFFTKNHWMVSDIREIIVMGSRARLRGSRLVTRGGNLYSFIAAPQQVH